MITTPWTTFNFLNFLGCSVVSPCVAGQPAPDSDASAAAVEERGRLSAGAVEERGGLSTGAVVEERGGLSAGAAVEERGKLKSGSADGAD